MGDNGDMDSCIGLNVRGKIYQTSRATLERYRGSYFDGLLDGSVPSTKDDDGNYVIQRNGDIFRHVLNFMRYGKIVLPEEFNQFHLLEREADFLMLEELKVELRDVKKAEGDVGLNVGGRVFRISRETLLRFPNSFFEDMLTQSSPTRDGQGNHLIDQDGDVFNHILNFLKSGELVLPEGFNEFDLLKHEAEFFKLKELLEAINDKQERTVGYVINEQVFTLRRDDVLKEKDSLFAAMIGGEFPAKTDPRGNYIIGRAVDVVHILIHYIKGGGIFRDMTKNDVMRLKKEAEYFRMFVLMALHLKSIEEIQAQRNRGNEHLYIYIIFDHRPSSRHTNECIAYTNMSSSFLYTNILGHAIHDVFVDGKLIQVIIGDGSVCVGKLDLRKINQGNGRINVEDFVSYFTSRMTASVDMIRSCGYFTLLKVTAPLKGT